MKNIIEKIKRIEEIEKETERLNLQVKELQMERLNGILEVAKEKLKYAAIYKQKMVCFGSEVKYFKDENGEYLKGVCLWDEGIKYEEDREFTYVELDELFLMEDGSLKVFKETIETEKFGNGEEVIYTRELIEGYDITNLYIDGAIANIGDLLEDRINDLNYFLDVAKTRLKEFDEQEDLKITNRAVAKIDITFERYINEINEDLELRKEVNEAFKALI